MDDKDVVVEAPPMPQPANAGSMEPPKVPTAVGGFHEHTPSEQVSESPVSQADIGNTAVIDTTNKPSEN